MTELSKLSLAIGFCKEILGWRKSEPAGFPCEELMYTPKDQDTQFFRFSNLDAVLRSARDWCHVMRSHPQVRGRSFGLALRYGTHGRIYTAEVRGGKIRGIWSSVDPCCAVMGACIQARLKIGVAA